MRRRPVVVLVAALTVAVGGGAAWGWETRAVSLAGMAGHDRAGSAVAAVQQDDRLAAGLTDRSAGVAGRDLVGGSLAALSQAIPAAHRGSQRRVRGKHARGAPLTLADLEPHLNENLARFKHPKDIVIVDELPRNAGGKVVKPTLRQSYGSKDAGLAD